MLTRPLNISCDFDGTLMQNPYWRLHLKPWLISFGQSRRQSWPELWQLMLQESLLRLQKGQSAGAYDWKDIVHTLFQAYLPDPAVPPRSQVLPLVYPDVWDFLHWSFNYPVRLHLVTNGFMTNQLPYLKALGWDKILASWTGSERGFTKPDPRIFDGIPDLDIHIGDRLAHDVLGAKRASVFAVHLKRHDVGEEQDGWDPLSPAHCQADLTIKTLEEMPKAIQLLLPTIVIRKAGWL
ncbi:HAD family hydrolase [Sulfobacillus thermosulfidooxidans]|uniref:HAD family hydrolase n=1 Tax=Sulfobacillus thermosulfidooxidans TaxID=28034 RepID=UPI0006B6884B|nr:HAD family hydrolase [Sulfobacillus thermosulfidooxidans]